MQEITLQAKHRRELGKKGAKIVRAQGRIPAVLYGPDSKPTALSLDAKSLYTLLQTGRGENVLINLNIENGKTVSKKVLIREVQHDPVRGNVIHVDFQSILLTKKITVKVPIQIVGVPIGVRADGGIMQFVLRELEVECLPTEIPEKVEIDVSELKIGDGIHVRDVKLAKVTLLSDPQGSIVTVVPPMKEEVVAPVVTAPTEPEVITERKPEEGEEEVPAEGKEAKGKETKGKEVKVEKKAPEPAKAEEKKPEKKEEKK